MTSYNCKRPRRPDAPLDPNTLNIQMYVQRVFLELQPFWFMISYLKVPGLQRIKNAHVLINSILQLSLLIQLFYFRTYGRHNVTTTISNFRVEIRKLCSTSVDTVLRSVPNFGPMTSRGWVTSHFGHGISHDPNMTLNSSRSNEPIYVLLISLNLNFYSVSPYDHPFRVCCHFWDGCTN